MSNIFYVSWNEQAYEKSEYICAKKLNKISSWLTIRSWSKLVCYVTISSNLHPSLIFTGKVLTYPTTVVVPKQSEKKMYLSKEY